MVARLVFGVPESCEELIGYKLKKKEEGRDEVVEVVEHVIYRFDEDRDDEGRLKIGEVWSVVDEGDLRRNSVQ